MNNKQKFGCVLVILSTVITAPLYLALLFLILKHIQATDTIWLLFWIYAPISFIVTALFRAADGVLEDKK